MRGMHHGCAFHRLGDGAGSLHDLARRFVAPGARCDRGNRAAGEMIAQPGESVRIYRHHIAPEFAQRKPHRRDILKTTGRHHPLLVIHTRSHHDRLGDRQSTPRQHARHPGADHQVERTVTNDRFGRRRGGVRSANPGNRNDRIVDQADRLSFRLHGCHDQHSHHLSWLAQSSVLSQMLRYRTGSPWNCSRIGPTSTIVRSSPPGVVLGSSTLL